MKKISRSTPSLLFLAIGFLFLFSCSSAEITSETPPEQNVSDAALLDESEKATPVMDDSAIFSDLNAQAVKAESSDFSSDPAPSASSNSSEPFYNPIGGESLSRVTYLLYGDKKLVNKLRDLNADLRGTKKLEVGQKVYFSFADLKPVPTHLTKDLLDRYSAELAEKVKVGGLTTETVALGQGETLQSVSKRLNGTTRYWPEIFLLNRDVVANYDQVKAGLSLTVFRRAPASIGSAETPPPAPSFVASGSTVDTQRTLSPAGKEEKMAEIPSPPAPAPISQAAPEDPIPETPSSFAETISTPPPTQAAPPKREVPPPTYVPQEVSSFSSSNNANPRRLIYVALILLIGGLAFYLTRSGKKKKFDMLDVTASDTAGSPRERLNSKDSQQKGVS